LAEEELIGACDEMVAIGKQIAKVAGSDTNVLVQGETGTGKDVIAMLIHKKSNRATGPLISINCCAVPENLLESEFFGYEKGAFTGAFNRRKGLIEQADGGTLHLDEVGNMPLALQAKLLRILEERRFRRIGGIGEVKVDIRLVASTNNNLWEAIEEDRFRLDFYYRLNTFSIRIPPLRERGKDIILLARYYIEKNNLKFGRNVKDISDEAQTLLLSYSWPGNVRELKNVIERAILVLPPEVTILRSEHIPLEHSFGASLFLGLPSAYLRPEAHVNEGLNYYQVTEGVANHVKRRIIERALQLTGGNKTKAAKMLHLSRSALWREMEKINRWGEKGSSLFEQ
jgi:transcriptional regulator with PAS, ATPase and Fis domain